MDRRINQTDEACTLRGRFNARADRIALPDFFFARPSSTGVSSKLNAMTHGRGQSTWIFIIAPSDVVVTVQTKLTRPDTAGMCVSLRERPAERSTMERLAHRLDCDLCASLIAELANATPRTRSSRSQPFRYAYLAADSRDARKIPAPPG